MQIGIYKEFRSFIGYKLELYKSSIMITTERIIDRSAT